MIEVENITDIDLEKLDKEIQKQFTQKNNNEGFIFLCNSMLIGLPFILPIGLLVYNVTQITSFIPIILTSATTLSGTIFFSIMKKIYKKKNKRLIKELNNNISIQRQLEFNKNHSIEVTEIELTKIKVKKTSLTNIEEIDLPEITRTTGNKNKPKIRILKKDKNNVRK